MKSLAVLCILCSTLAHPSVFARDRGDAPPSRLVPYPDVPKTWLQPVQADAQLAPAAPAGRLHSGGGAAGGPVMPQSRMASSSPTTTRLSSMQTSKTVLREAEVPQHLRQRTVELTRELQAVQTPKQEISIDLPADVLFDFDKAELRPDAMPSIAKTAELLQSYPSAPITVIGHTDGKGSDAYNDDLSLRRARAVAAVLQRHSGGRSTKVQGMGKRQPVAPNTKPDGSDDPQGRQLNRRVQILIGLPVG